MKLVRFVDLPDYGIKYSRPTIAKMIKRGTFPCPSKTGDAKSARLLWNENDLIAYQFRILNAGRNAGGAA